ncbi:MAG: hypothetical protein ACKVT1_09610 [Dehalococcoidia bacterium]
MVSELPDWALADVARLLTEYLAMLPWSAIQSAEPEDEALSPTEVEALESWRSSHARSQPLVADTLNA